MTREELKPCLFCGGRNIVKAYRQINDTTWHFYACDSCGARGPERLEEENAFDGWNRRAPQPPKRWTAADGTPPDGLYLIDVWFAQVLPWVKISKDKNGFKQVQWYELDGTHIKHDSTAIVRLWNYFDKVYGPIEEAAHDGPIESASGGAGGGSCEV